MEALMDLNPAALPPRKRLKSLGSSASPPSTPTTPPPHRSSPLAGPSTRPSSETNESSLAQTTLLKRKQPEPREREEEELFIFSNQGLPPRKATAPHIKPRGNPSPFPSDSEPEQPRRGRPGRKPGSSKKPIKRPRNEPLYCLCRQPYDEEVFMIACDVCNDWFHGECVGMTERKAQSLKTYICPPCTKSRTTGRRKSVVKEEIEDERVNVDGDSGDEGEESPQEFQRSKKEASASMRGRRGSTTAVGTSATRRRSGVSTGISGRMSHVDEESAQVATGETDSSKEDVAPRRVCANKSCHHSAKPNSKYCSTECGVHVATQFLEKQKAAAAAAAAATAPEQMRIASPKPSPKPGDVSLSFSNADLPNFSSIKRSLENSPDISAADDTDLKQLESLERQRREVEQNLRSLAVKRDDFEQAVRFSATLFATPTSSATSASASSDQASQEAPEVMDCFSCGQPIAGRNFARHIEQCYTKKEGINTTSSGAVLLSASKLEARTLDDGTVIAFCNRYDATREAYCAHVLDSCPVHSDKKGLDEHRLCGCPTGDFKSGHCERLRSECVKHFNWENIRKMEMKLEKKRQTQLLGSLDAEIELVKTRIRRRNQTRDDEHRTIEENGASNTRQHSPASK